MKFKSNIMLYFIVLCAGLVLISYFIVQYFNQRPIDFNKQVWLNELAPDYSTRFRMVEDLIKRYKLTGMKREELVNLLGQPENYTDVDSASAYYLLKEKYDVIDPISIDHLVLLFDSTGHIREYKIKHWEKGAT